MIRLLKGAPLCAVYKGNDREFAIDAERILNSSGVKMQICARAFFFKNAVFERSPEFKMKYVIKVKKADEKRASELLKGIGRDLAEDALPPPLLEG